MLCFGTTLVCEHLCRHSRSSCWQSALSSSLQLSRSCFPQVLAHAVRPGGRAGHHGAVRDLLRVLDEGEAGRGNRLAAAMGEACPSALLACNVLSWDACCAR